MATILQRDAAAELVDVILSACNDESVKATLQNDDILTTKPTTTIQIPQPNDEDVDEIDINDTSCSSLEEYAGSDQSLSPTTTDSTPALFPLTHVRPALSKLTAAARLIDLLSASYDAEDARDLLGDTNAWHSFEDCTETIDALYDRYRTVLYEFADAATEQQQKENEEGTEVIAETYREGMQALARVLRGSCDPLPYRLRQVHTALVGNNGAEKKGGPEVVRQVEEEARVLLRAANDRCIEEADDFLAYYVTVRRLFLHLVASEAKAVMVMAVALQYGGIPHYIHPSDVTTARQLLAEQDAFLDRVIPKSVVRLAERVLTASPTGDNDSSAGVEVTIQTHTAGGSREVRPSAGEGSEIVCPGSNEAEQQQRPFVWTLEAAEPVPKEDGDAVGRYTFHIRNSGSTSSPSASPTYLGCNDKGDIINVTSSTRPSGTWRIATMQIEAHHLNGMAAAGAAIPVAFRLQYRSADMSGGKSHGKWLAPMGDGGRLGLRELEGESPEFLFDISPVEG